MNLQVILSNERDKRTYEWLLATAGIDAINTALSSLSGNRKPYVSNVCKELGLTPPEQFQFSSKATAQTHLNALRDLLKKQGV